MPGYACDRFPDLSAEDQGDYTCNICQQIFNTPVTTTFCRHTFCEDCITQWLQTNTTCPFERKPLSKGDLLPAPRVMLDSLDEFNMKCDYWDSGCREVIKLEDLSQHTVNCSYKSVKCSKCQCALTSGHDCIDALRAEIEELKLTQSCHADNSCDTIGGGSSSSDHSVISDRHILAECRRHLSVPELLDTGMSADWTDKTLAIISEQLAKQNSLYLVCKYVVNQMELEFGSQWHCTADSGPDSSEYYRVDNDRHLKVKFTPITFRVFYSAKLDWSIFLSRLSLDKIVCKLNIFYTDMKPSMLPVVSRIVKGVLVDAANRRALSMKATAADIGADMGNIYPGRKWQCIIYGNGSANYHVTNAPGTYLHCHVDQLSLLLFQVKSTNFKCYD